MFEIVTEEERKFLAYTSVIFVILYQTIHPSSLLQNVFTDASS